MPRTRPRFAASLSTRLAAALALILALGGTAVTVAALAYGRQAARQAYDQLLIGAANQIAGSISIHDGEVVVDIPPSAFELLALARDDRVVYAVFGPAGQLITGYDGLSPPGDVGEAAFRQGIFGGEPVRLVAVRRRFAERAFSGAVDVVVGQTLRARRELARNITENALLVVGGAGLVMAGLVVFAIRSALQPLRRIERGLSGREPQDLTPLDVAVPREIEHLTAAINRFMARLDRQVTATRRLIADASHQLRTPVTALRAQAELAAAETDPERQRAIVARIHDRAVSLSRLTDQMLSHALIIHRAEAEPLGRIDLREVALRAVEETDQERPEAASTLNLDLSDDPVPCRGDTLSLVEATKNLINNAARYGRPPVTVAAFAAGATATLCVRDRGPGIPEEHWDDAAQRFARNAASSPGGAGLGLAIVGAVAEAHAGTLAFRRTAAGEFEAALTLPADDEEAEEA